MVAEGEAPQSFYSDVGKFLSLQDLPTVISTGTATVDIAQALAAQIAAPAATFNSDDSPFNVATVKATWQSQDGVPEIMAQAVRAVQEIPSPKFTKVPAAANCASDPVYQFKTTVDVGPAAVSQAFQNAFDNAVPPGSGKLTAKPVTKLTQYNTVIP